jgi:excisionase family DNA binding protein
MEYWKEEAQADTTKPILVSKKEAAAALGICVRTLEHLIAAKELSVRRIGKRCLVPYVSLLAFARRDHPTQVADPDTD